MIAKCAPVPSPSQRIYPDPQQRNLPRLTRPHYQGFAVVHWTLTMQSRATGWLDDRFHLHFREWLLHAAAREGLFCPVYCLMPDHAHLVWMGMKTNTDQLNAMKFLRRFCNEQLAACQPVNHKKPADLSAPAAPCFKLQSQAHDHVLRPEERRRNAFARVCFYILENPVRAQLVTRADDYPFSGAVVPGYPSLRPFEDDYWPLFWKLYEQERELPTP